MYPTQVFALRWLASAATPPFPMQQLLLPGGTLLEQHARRHAGDWTEGGEKLFFMKPVESRRVGWAEENMHRRKLTTTYNGLNETQRSAVRCPACGEMKHTLGKQLRGNQPTPKGPCLPTPFTFITSVLCEQQDTHMM